MGMRNYANSGFVVPAKELANLLEEPSERVEWLALLDSENDMEKLENWFSSNLSPFSSYAHVAPTFFVLNDECESEDLEIGEVYAAFDEADLFEIIPSPALRRLQNRGVNPENKRWVTFG